MHHLPELNEFYMMTDEYWSCEDFVILDIHLYWPETVANNEKKKKKCTKTDHLLNIQIRYHTQWRLGIKLSFFVQAVHLVFWSWTLTDTRKQYLYFSLRNFDTVQQWVRRLYQLFAVLYQAFARGLIEDGAAGAIVNISSQASQHSLPYHAVYSTSKAAVDQLTRCLAYELGPHKVPFLCCESLLNSCCE